jgi:hypothetical protein
MSAVRIARGARLRRGVPAVVAGLVTVAALAAGSPAQASAAAVTHAAAARAAASGGTWGKAEEIPGIAALNKGGEAALTSVSCASAGNCSAGGYYQDSHYDFQAFVVDETDGTWGKAEEVPGTAALNQGGPGYPDAHVNSVSCDSAGNCSAGGYYTDDNGDRQAFVASEMDGTWGTAEEVPGTAALDQGDDAQTISLSCASAGNCSAGGYYTDGSRNQQVFVVSETDGTWGTAEEVPGTAALNQGGGALITSVSCASAGNCSGGGSYTDGSGHAQAFVVTEKGGTWGKAEEVPGTAALNKGGSEGPADAQVSSMSCSSASHCSAGGYYTDGSGHAQAFIVGET